MLRQQWNDVAKIERNNTEDHVNTFSLGFLNYAVILIIWAKDTNIALPFLTLHLLHT